MNKIPTEITLTVYADPDYHYNVIVSDETFAVDYVDSKEYRVSFSSLDEMEKVARTMLMAVELRKKMNEKDSA